MLSLSFFSMEKLLFKEIMNKYCSNVTNRSYVIKISLFPPTNALMLAYFLGNNDFKNFLNKTIKAFPKRNYNIKLFMLPDLKHEI